MLSELNKLFKLIWQKKKCCDNKSWKYFFLQSLLYVIDPYSRSCAAI